MQRAALEARWLELTNILLPACAKERDFPVCLNHCFQRIFLDNACNDVWYHTITQRPAYKHASDMLLHDAVHLAELVWQGKRDIHKLNYNSLKYRGKA